MRNVSSGFLPEQRQMEKLPHGLFSEESSHQVTQANTMFTVPMSPRFCCH